MIVTNQSQATLNNIAYTPASEGCSMYNKSTWLPALRPSWKSWGWPTTTTTTTTATTNDHNNNSNSNNCNYYLMIIIIMILMIVMMIIIILFNSL